MRTSNALTASSDEIVLRKSTFKPSALAQSLSVGRTKKSRVDAGAEIKRAAIVLRRGMRQNEFRRIEMRMTHNSLSSLPIVIGNRRSEVPETVCGLIVTGSSAIAHAEERSCLAEIIREALGRQLPVLAISDATPIVLGEAGYEQPDGEHAAVLVGEGVQVLKSRRDIDQAIDMMAASPTR
jgi:hypothetical protein